MSIFSVTTARTARRRLTPVSNYTSRITKRWLHEHRSPINSRGSACYPAVLKFLFLLYARNIVLSRHLHYILVIRIYFIIYLFYFYEIYNFFLRESRKMEKWKEVFRTARYIYIYSFFLIESLSRTDDRERMEIFLFEHGTRRKEDSENNNNSHVITRKIEWRIIIENIYVIINRYIVVEIERKWEKRKKKKKGRCYSALLSRIFFLYILKKILEK